MTRRFALRRNTLLVYGACAVLIALKLWLTSEIRIVPVYGPHDATNFLEHAKSILLGHWFGTYDVLTLIKGPAFPLYLAAVQELGLPLPLAHQLLYALASMTALAAAAPVVRGAAARVGLFAVLLFNPFTFAMLAWVTYRSQLTESLALVALAAAFAIFVRRRAPLRVLLPWFALLGVAFAAFWLTREEGIWLVPSLAVLLGSYVWAARRGTRREIAVRLAPFALPALVWIIAEVGVMLINGKTYGWYTTVEMQAPEFVSAYNSLARIEVPPVYRVPVPRAARELAYRASPAAAELRHGLDGASGQAWTNTTCSTWNVCGDIGGGWFMWALRDAVAEAGHYTSGGAARAYYVELSRQLDAACDARTIPCRAKARTMVPPLGPGDGSRVAAEVVGAIRLATTWSQWSLEHWPAPPPNPSMERDYAFVVRAVDQSGAGTEFKGWLVHEPLRALAVAGDPNAEIVFRRSPDIESAFARQPAYRGAETAFARFTIWTSCAQDCALVVKDGRGRDLRVPLDPAVHDARQPGLVYHLDTAATPESSLRVWDDGVKTAMLRRIAHLYQAVMPYATAVVLLLTVFRGLRAIRRRTIASSAHAVLAAAVLLSGTFLLTVLALIDVTSFPGFNPEYMGALFPIMLFAWGTALAVEATVARRLVRLPFASRARLIGAGTVLAAGALLGGAFLRATPAMPAAAGAAAPVTSPLPGRAFSCTRPLTRGAGVARGALDELRLADQTAAAHAPAVIEPDAILVLRGWAADAAARHPVAGVCVTIDGKTSAHEIVSYGATRPDVAAAFKQPDLAATGYEIRLSAADLAPGRHQVAVVGVDARGREEPIAAGRTVTIR